MTASSQAGDNTPSVIVDCMTPESVGWVRIPEYDAHGGKAYEQPNGDIYMFPPGVAPKVFRFPSIGFKNQSTDNARRSA